MKASELRVGNIVYLKSKNKTYTIESGYEIDNGCDSEDFARIPMDEEWFFKFGFTRAYESESSYSYVIGHNKHSCDVMLEIKQVLVDGMVVHHPIYRNGGYPVKTVHQLQNLYHALTGEELTFKS